MKAVGEWFSGSSSGAVYDGWVGTGHVRRRGVRACVRACVCACVCVRACVCACVRV